MRPLLALYASTLAGCGQPPAGGLRPAEPQAAASARIYETPTKTLVGLTSTDSFGSAFASAGDVNGDGYDDVVLGAPGAAGGGGEAYVHHGSATSVPITPTVTLAGPGSPISFGYAVAGAGDVNGDGYADVLVSDPDAGSYGSIYVYHGSATGIGASPDATLEGDSSSSSFGIEISPAGDVNGDGYADVLVGDDYGMGGAGAAYLYLGGPAGLDTAPATTLTGSILYGYFGYSVSNAGDVNGDGYDDVIVGAYAADAYYGQAYVYHGNATGLDSAPAATLEGTIAYGYYAYTVSDAGDVNGDGYDDVIVAADGNAAYLGQAYVHHGGPSGVSALPDATLSGLNTTDYFSWGLSNAGDVNADGYDDVLVGANGFSSSTGQAYVFLGAASGVSTTAASTVTGIAPSTYFGRDTAAAGDVDGDGYDDVLVGATGAAGYKGHVYLFRGYADDDEDGFGAADDCDDADPGINPDASEVCDGVDNNCDGTADGADSAGATEWYPDTDGDGFTGEGDPVLACDAPDGYAAISTEIDCDDDDSGAYPGAAETAGDGIDQDCDGEDLPGGDTDEPDDTSDPADDTDEPGGDDTDAAGDEGGGDGGGDGGGEKKGCSTLGSGSHAPLALLTLLGALLARRRRP